MKPHRRKNLLTNEWVLVSPHRTQRPWTGQVDDNREELKITYDENCYLCPGNKRAGGMSNPDYKDVFVFDNDFPALLDESSIHNVKSSLLKSKEVKGRCRVICFSPDHSKSIGEMSINEIVTVIKTWQNETKELGKKYQWVQIFENKGEIMGCSNPHPHCQIWALDDIPTIPSKENEIQKDYFEKNGKPLLLDYLQEEIKLKERIVFENDNFVVLVPFWATWPFETMIVTNGKLNSLIQLEERQLGALAEAIKILTNKYDKLFNVRFPYSMGWHQAPFNREDNSHWLLHAHYYPPLLRSASVKKFMVGFEMLGEAQRDITPEMAAERLRGIDV